MFSGLLLCDINAVVPFLDELDDEIASSQRATSTLPAVLEELDADADDFLLALDDKVPGKHYTAEAIVRVLKQRGIVKSASTIRLWRRERRDNVDG